MWKRFANKDHAAITGHNWQLPLIWLWNSLSVICGNGANHVEIVLIESVGTLFGENKGVLCSSFPRLEEGEVMEREGRQEEGIR